MNVNLKKRSPNYPKVDLGEALSLARKIYEGAHTGPFDKDTGYLLMGYSGENGRSLSAISALKKFGLLEGKGTELRITPFALSILEPSSPYEKQSAINAAAKLPELYREILERYGRAPVSDEVLRAFLIRERGFAASGSEEFIKAFRTTMSLVKDEPQADARLSVEETDSGPTVRIEPLRLPQGPAEVVREARGSSVREAASSSHLERLQCRVSPTSIAEVTFDGPITQKGIEKLIAFLQLTKDVYPDTEGQPATLTLPPPQA